MSAGAPVPSTLVTTASPAPVASTIAAGRRSATILMRSAPVSSGFSGVTVTPSLRAPQSAATKRQPLAIASTTLSLARTPWAESARATPPARRSRAAHVSAPPSQTSAGAPGSRRAVASSSRAKFSLTRDSGEVVLQVDPLPDLGRHAVARRVRRQRRLGRGVHPPLRGVPVLPGGRVEVRAARGGDDGDVAIGLAARGDGPGHLAVVEDVHVLVHHDHALHVEIGAEHGQDGVLGLAGEA